MSGWSSSRRAGELNVDRDLRNLSPAVSHSVKLDREGLDTGPASVQMNDIILFEDEPVVFHLARH